MAARKAAASAARPRAARPQRGVERRELGSVVAFERGDRRARNRRVGSPKRPQLRGFREVDLGAGSCGVGRSRHLVAEREIAEVLLGEHARRQDVSVVVVDVRNDDGLPGEAHQPFVDGVHPMQSRGVPEKHHAARDVGEPAERPEEMVGVAVEPVDAGPEPRQDFARDVGQLRTVDFIRVQEQHPVGRSRQRLQHRESPVAHVRKVDEGVAAEVERPPLRERAGLERGAVGADRFARVVVDGQDVDDRRDRLERGRQIAFGRRSNAKDASDGHG